MSAQFYLPTEVITGVGCFAKVDHVIGSDGR